MKSKVLLFVLVGIFSLLLLQNVSAVATYGEWSNGNANIVVPNGQNAVFNVDFFSINPPMTVSVLLYSQAGDLLHSFENVRPVSDYGFSGNYTVTPAMYQSTAGLYNVVLTATDSFSSTDSYMLTMSVGSAPPTNNAPSITSTPITTMNENAGYVYDVNALDSDGDMLTYSLTTGPAWLIMNPYDGRLTGVAPSVTANTAFPIVVTVTDGFVSVNQQYTLTVNDVVISNDAPVITSSPLTSLNENTAYTYQVVATDANNNILTYSIVGPSWLSINSSTGLVSGTSPVVSANTQFNVTITVSDGTASANQPYVVTVLDVPSPGNNAPVITSTPTLSVNENAAYNYQVVATDADNDTLTYSVSGAPWLSINAATGLVSGTAPSVAANTPFSITITVSDGADATTQVYTLTVQNGSSTPSTPSKRGGGSGVRMISDTFEEQQYLNQFFPIRVGADEAPSVDVSGGFSFATLFWIIVFVALAALIVWLVVRLMQ